VERGATDDSQSLPPEPVPVKRRMIGRWLSAYSHNAVPDLNREEIGWYVKRAKAV